jgi:hypothetical protein
LKPIESHVDSVLCQCFKSKYDEPLTNLAVNFNWCPFIKMSRYLQQVGATDRHGLVETLEGTTGYDTSRGYSSSGVETGAGASTDDDGSSFGGSESDASDAEQEGHEGEQGRGGSGKSSASTVGTGGQCSPCHRVPCHSRDERSQFV